MWPVTEPNIVRQMRGLEPNARLSGELREYVRTEWNGDGGAVLGMIAKATRKGITRRRARQTGTLQRLFDGIKALVRSAVPGRA
jgi:hypothetical protein